MTYSCCDPSFKVMERNPEIRQMLNNPEVLRQVTVLKALSKHFPHSIPQMMEIARNPSRLQEMTRTMDRQMQNLESMPGGQVTLTSMIKITFEFSIK